jgi:intracellular sulfur oxidation DsrE/DsrF family protein
MKKKPLLATTVLALLATLAAVSQPASGPKYHTIFQFEEAQGQAWETLFPHVENLQAALKDQGGVEVEVVFFGPGLNMLRKTNTAYEARLKRLADAGVKLAACQNAMKLMNLKTEDLFPFAAQVDSAMAELTRKQQEGWSYIH